MRTAFERGATYDADSLTILALCLRGPWGSGGVDTAPFSRFLAVSSGSQVRGPKGPLGFR